MQSLFWKSSLSGSKMVFLFPALFAEFLINVPFFFSHLFFFWAFSFLILESFKI